MTAWSDLAVIGFEAGLELARKTLSTADFSQGLELLTDEQREVYYWIEMLYYDGEITYKQLWDLCPRNPLPKE